jgi:hypothetical protein
MCLFAESDATCLAVSHGCMITARYRLDKELGGSSLVHLKMANWAETSNVYVRNEEKKNGRPKLRVDG